MAGAIGDTEEVFQSPGDERISLHIEEDIGTIRWWKGGEAYGFTIGSNRGEQFVGREGIRIGGPAGQGFLLQPGLCREFLERLARQLWDDGIG